MNSLSVAADPWRVLLADDHGVLREGLAMLVGAQGDMRVVAQARSGREAIALAKQWRPHVAVLDVSMPDINGPEAAEHIRAECPDVKVLALTRHADPAYLRRMFRAGASGYVVKRAAADVLMGAIRVVAQGGTYVDPSLAGSLLARIMKPAGDAHSDKPKSVLSEREEQVLRLIAWGKSNKEVAAQLGISVKTAEFYKASALDKLKLRTRTDILRHALSQRWLSDDEDPE